MLEKLELTLGIFKPHIMKNPFALKEIKNIIIENNFQIVRSKILLINNEQARKFYAEHENKFFYNRLLTFMTSGISQVLILTRTNAIAEWRNVMGPTKVYKTIYSHPKTIRGLFGLSDTRNATHGSDSPESVEKEAKIFFPDFNISEWYNEEELYYRNLKTEFLENMFLHKIVK